MSSVGFTSQSKNDELEKLRDACRSVNDVLRNLASAQDCMDALNFGSARDYLEVAQWHASEVKKVITSLGQAKSQKAGR